ncbi:MAG: AraC family transcriptional regulator, partial [Polyangiaceae bacterium]|nr:AraC family transcriptional regulator [Polyangiaceae bacterium]
MGATIIASVVARVVDEGVRRGVDPRALASIVGERPGLVADARVAIDAAYRCFALCLETTRDPAFPLAVARSISVEDYSVLGFASLTSPSVEVVFERMVRYGHLITDSGAWQTRRTAAHFELTWVRAGRRTLGHRAANECAVAE